MIGFIDTSWRGDMVPIDAIKRVGSARKDKDKNNTHVVELDDGRTITLFETQVHAMKLRPVQLIPADYGTKLLHMTIAETIDTSEIWDTPVIAWALCLDGEIRPVTPNGVLDGGSDDDDHYVQLPGNAWKFGSIQAVGQFTDPSGFDDREAMLQHFFTVEYAKKKGADGFVSEMDAEVAPQAQA